MTYLLANTASGVWEVESLDGEDCLAVDQQSFFALLPVLKDGQLIGSQVDAEWYSKVDEHYGVQFLQ